MYVGHEALSAGEFLKHQFPINFSLNGVYMEVLSRAE
jgi:hypothetical protein